jgi:hypothetical protein
VVWVPVTTGKLKKTSHRRIIVHLVLYWYRQAFSYFCSTSYRMASAKFSANFMNQRINNRVLLMQNLFISEKLFNKNIKQVST